MTGDELHAELDRRHHNYLHHACTLTTFRSYASLGAYRARAFVEENGLDLTPQVSDPADRQLGVWDHVFLNIFDQHGDVHKGKSVTGINKYGPVLMVFEAAVLQNVTEDILGYTTEITAAGYDAALHDVTSIEALRTNTFADPSPTSTSDLPSRRPGTPGPNMCVHFADTDAAITFKDLFEVVVDKMPPKHAQLQEAAVEELKNVLSASAPHARLSVRQCIDACYCHRGYAGMTASEVRDFFYKTNAHVYAMPRAKLRGFK